MKRNLYKVHCIGNISDKRFHPFVIADNPTEAYEYVLQFLTKNQIGFSSERVLHDIELLAEPDSYTEAGGFLLLPDDMKMGD